MSSKTKRIVAAVIAAVLVFALLASMFLSLIVSASAAKSSTEIANERYGLETEADGYAQQAENLHEQAEATQQRALEAIEKKLTIDQAIVELESEIAKIKSEVQQLNLDIAAKQEELDQAVSEENAMTERFRVRLRAMEENGTGGYWSVIFRASSLSDMLDQISMIADINKADQELQDELIAARELVAQEQSDLETARAERSEMQAELEIKQTQLADMRAEMDQMIIELCADNDLFLAAQAEAERIEAELREQSLALLDDYNDAVRREAAAAAAAARNNSSRSSNSASSSGFMLPVPSGSASVTDAYGMRWHPVKQKYSFHTGVDLACGYGTAIYATKSGTVIESMFNSTYGNYVTIQHSDGSSSMYAHMSSSAVSSGDYVSQGSVIGYVGSTGISTGPHLHFEIYINGGTVNPMDYVSLY